jgi:hypothetical protein
LHLIFKDHQSRARINRRCLDREKGSCIIFSKSNENQND